MLLGDIALSARTLRGPQRDARWTDHLIATGAMVATTAALGAILAKLPPDCDPETFFPVWPCTLPYLLIGGAIFGLAFLPIGLLGLLSLRGLGFGGSPALGLGALLANIGGLTMFPPDDYWAVLTITGATLALPYWLALFIRCRT